LNCYGPCSRLFTQVRSPNHHLAGVDLAAAMTHTRHQVRGGRVGLVRKHAEGVLGVVGKVTALDEPASPQVGAGWLGS